MSNRSGQKGWELEHMIEVDLQENGCPDAYRPRAGQQQDKGDILAGPSRTVIECKNRKEMKLSTWWRETQQETANHHDADLGILIHKRRGKGQANDQWVTMDWATCKQLLREAGRLPDA